MIVTYKEKAILTRDRILGVLEAPQNDGNTRAVELSLEESDRVPWKVPAGVTAAVAYRKADGTKGIYDKLPNKAAATSIDGSTVTAILAPQVLTVPGEVKLSIVLFDAQLDRLATFPLKLIVTPDPSAGQAVSNDYYNFTTLEEVNAAVDAALAELEEAKQDFLTKAEEALAVVHDSATEDAPAIVCKGEGEIVSVSDAAYRPLVGLKLFGKTTQDGTPTPSAPVELVSAGASGAINTTVAGKNLYGFDEITVSSHQSIKLPFTLPAGTYTFSGYVTSTDTDETTSAIGVIAVGEAIPLTYASFYRNTYNARTITIDKPCDRIRLLCATSIGASSGDTSTWTKVQIEFGSVATEYEPYREVQTLTASTPNGLPGIPVSSGGNYTDADGQQYLSTYRDWARGVDVHRIGGGKLTDIPKWNAPEVLAGLDDWRLIGAPVPSNWYRNNTAYKYQRTTGLFTHGSYNEHWAAGYTHGFMSMANVYVVAPKEIAADADTFKAWITAQDAAGNTPEIMVVLDNDRVIETPIPAEELAAYAALHSNKPNTTVYNDAGAHMAVEYVADTKIYTDNKFAALQAAILSQGANV